MFGRPNFRENYFFLNFGVELEAAWTLPAASLRHCRGGGVGHLVIQRASSSDGRRTGAASTQHRANTHSLTHSLTHSVVAICTAGKLSRSATNDVCSHMQHMNSTRVCMLIIIIISVGRRQRNQLFISATLRSDSRSMKLRVQDQGEDQRRPGKRLYVRTVKHVS